MVQIAAHSSGSMPTAGDEITPAPHDNDTSIGDAGTPTFDWLPTNQLFVDYTYARPLSQTKVSRIRRVGFDLNAVGTLYVSQRADGTYAIMDGQHRHATAQLEHVDTLPCWIYHGLTRQQEAKLYFLYGAVRWNQSARDAFRALVEADDPGARDVLRVVEQVGLSVQLERGQAGLIGAVHALRRIHERHGAHGLREVLSMAKDAWGLDPRAYQQYVLLGLAAFWSRYYRVGLDRDYFKERFAATPIPQLIAKAKMTNETLGGDASSAYGQAILKIYNDGRRTKKLPAWSESRPVRVRRQAA